MKIKVIPSIRIKLPIAISHEGYFKLLENVAEYQGRCEEMTFFSGYNQTSEYVLSFDSYEDLDDYKEHELHSDYILKPVLILHFKGNKMYLMKVVVFLAWLFGGHVEKRWKSTQRHYYGIIFFFWNKVLCEVFTLLMKLVGK